MSARAPRHPTVRLLRHAPLARLLAAGLATDTGDWLLLIALPVYVLQQTGSALITSTVFVFELVPSLLFGPLAGVLVDRWDRRRALLTAYLGQAVMVLPLLAVSHGHHLALIYVVTFVEASLAQITEPARAALLPAVVPPADLAAANGLGALCTNSARLLGGSLGGVLLVAAGLTGIVAADALTFVVAAILVLQIPPGRGRAGLPEPGAAARAGRVRREWADGLRLIRRNHQLRAGMVVACVSSIAQGIFVVLFVVFVVRSLHGTSAEVGLLRGVQAIGGIAAGILLAAPGRRASSRSLVAGSLLAFGAIDLAIWNLPGLTTSEGLYLGLFIAVGAPGAAYVAGASTQLQQLTADGMRGRVFSTFGSVLNVGQTLGMIAAGVLADRLPLIVILDAQAGLYLLAGALALALLRHTVASGIDRYPTRTSPPRCGVITSMLRLARSGSGRTGRIRRFAAARITSRISISANGAPAQRRTPPPYGIHDSGFGGGPSSHRSGRNAPACGQRSSRRIASHRQAATWTPAGTVRPAIRAGSSSRRGAIVSTGRTRSTSLTTASR
jgi:MFS family permease